MSAGDGSLFLSVVIPTHNRADRLERCLAAVLGPGYPRHRFEVIVADDASDTDLDPVIARHRGADDVRLLRLDTRRGPAAARNAGWRAARGDAVVFLDDDVEAAPGHLATVAEVLAGAGRSIAGVEGSVQPDDPAAAASSPFAHTLRTEGGGHTCNIVYWRAALEAVGGFDEGFPHAVGEDYDLAYRVTRLVGPIVYEPRLRVLHAVHGVRTLPDAWRQRRRSRPSLIRLFLKHPDRFPPHFVPAAFRGPMARLLSRPSVSAVAVYFVLQNVVSLAVHRGLLPRKPLLYLKWAFFLAIDSALVCGDLPSLARHHRAVSRELSLAGGAGVGAP